MDASESATEKSAEVAVNFVRDSALVPEPKAFIATTDAQGRAPRNGGSRRINFVDDGKLFEGHFTVQSTNLKSIIQYLMDRHNEQDIIIQDLQKQVHMLRSRSLKAGKRGLGAGVGGAADGSSFGSGGGGSADFGKRLKRVEQFLQLWGVQLSEVAELVEEYGDPTITPEAYTSYLLDLPAFRLTRREARALMLNASQPSAASANTAAASDTATRRRNSSAKREAASAAAAAAAASPSLEEKARSTTPEKRNTATITNANNTSNKKGGSDTAAVAEATLEKATAALEKAEMLLAELRSAAPRVAPPAAALKPRRAEAASKAAGSSGGGAAVDAEARADIEELGDYVMQRFDELETRTAMALTHAASTAGVEQRGAGRAAEEPTGKRGARPAPVPPPLPRANAHSGGRADGEVVDAVAREDAAASLDLLEELEATMERRFKDLSSAVAGVAARTAALARNNNNSNNSNNNNHHTGSSSVGVGSEKPSQHRTTSPAAEDGRRAKEQSASATAEDSADGGDGRSPASNSRTTSPSAKKSATPGRAGRQNSSDAGALIPVLPGTAPAAAASAASPAVLVDQTARDETVALAEHVSELEEELLDRWQAMEERLRIIGRAAMKQGITNASGNGAGPQAMGRAPAVDRKAREDAALSLMRLQQVEKELGQLKRQYAAGAGSSAVNHGAIDQTTPTLLPTVIAATEASGPLRDTYGSKVADLEKEVEQRMAEVNQAIAQLRGTGSATPLTLSPQKGDRSSASTVPVPPPTTGTTGAALNTSAAATLPPAGSQLTLHAADVAASAPSAGPVSPSPPPDLDERRRAALQSMLELGYSIDGDTNLFADFPRTSVRVGAGGRRTTISRLRSPDVPPFGSHLVQREVVEMPPMTAVKAAGQDGAAAQRDAATAATPVHAARRVSNVNGTLPHADEQAHSPSPHRSSKVAGVVSQHA